jgi:hypothetical protein
MRKRTDVLGPIVLETVKQVLLQGDVSQIPLKEACYSALSLSYYELRARIKFDSFFPAIKRDLQQSDSKELLKLDFHRLDTS